MKCEILGCCQFFKDNMKYLPKSEAYIKNKLCYNDYERCNRYRLYKAIGIEGVPLDFNPSDAEEVVKVIQCLGKHM